MDQNNDTDEGLAAYLTRYTRTRGPVVKIEKGVNLLGESIFRLVYFENNTFITVADGAVGWWRHRGGERYGPRSNYEGKTNPR